MSPCCQFLPNDLFLPQPKTSPRVDSVAASSSSGSTELAVKGPREAWEQMKRAGCIVLVDTHSHAHLERESSSSEELHSAPDIKATLFSLICAVEPADWKSCLAYAAQSTQRMSAIGIHPWYIMALDGESINLNDENSWLSQMERLLQLHPTCVVGEIGLCKRARFLRTSPLGKSAALALQHRVFIQQLKLAAKYQRPVSVHCVEQHTVLIDMLAELAASSSPNSISAAGERQRYKSTFLPPAIGLHSFTGTALHVRKLLQWEKDLKLSPRLKGSAPDAHDALLYFGFSYSVNVEMCTSEKMKKQQRLAVREVPRNRLMAESDVHCTSHAILGTAGSIGFIAWALDEPIETIAPVLAENGLRFLQSSMTSTAV